LFLSVMIGVACVEGVSVIGNGNPNKKVDDCITDVSPGIRWWICDDSPHNFTVAVPAQCLSSPCGVIVDVHGWSMDADMEEANTLIRRIAMNRSYIVVQPSEGSSRIPSWSPDEHYVQVHAFLLRVLSIPEWNIDFDRVHFTGFSQGGSMTWRFLCEWGDILASAAPGGSGGAGGSSFEQPCFEAFPPSPAAQIPIIFMMGEKDPGWESGLSQVERIIDQWNLNQSLVLEQSDFHRHIRYFNSDGYVLEFVHHTYITGCTVYPAGHCYPGGVDPTGEGFWMEPLGTGLSCPFPDPSQSEFIWGQKIVDFFAAHPRSKKFTL